MLTQRQKVTSIVRGVVESVAIALSLSVLVLVTQERMYNAKVASKREALAELPFDHFMQYYQIKASNANRSGVVKHRSKAYFKSDFEIPSLPESGLLDVTWRDRIACDRNPYDGPNIYKTHQQAVTASHLYTANTPRPGKNPEEFAEDEGYPVISLGTDNPIRYPEVDADCILITVITQYHEYGLVKVERLESDVVHVRGYDYR